MRSILVRLDDETFARLSRIARSQRRHPAEFIRRAIKAALLQHELDRIRDSYLRDPQLFADGGDWDEPLEWKP